VRNVKTNNLSASTARNAIKMSAKAFRRAQRVARLLNVHQVTTVLEKYARSFWVVVIHVCVTLTVGITITVVVIQNVLSTPRSQMVKTAPKTSNAKVSSVVLRITNATMLLKALEKSHSTATLHQAPAIP